MFKFKLFLLIVSMATLSSTSLAADTDVLHFHAVKNTPTEKHFSVIPKAGYKHNGGIKHRYNPNSIVYQQRLLLEQLRLEQDELDRQAELELRNEMENESQDADSLLGRMLLKPDRSIIRQPSDDGVLQDLIDLEKRAGKAQPLTE